MTLLPRPSSTSRSLSTDLRRFGLEWLYAPLRTGAVAPSGVALASAMTAALTEADGPVIELGPGTGVFTRALVARGIPADRIAAIEASAGFAAHLAAHHPDLRVIHGDAARIGHHSPFGRGEVGAVICGLPLLSMPPAKVFRILAGAFDTLRPGAGVRLFTYGGRCPVPDRILERLGLVKQRLAFVPLNIPPASVYLLSRRCDYSQRRA